MLQLQTYPVLHQNKPSRESIFCGKVGGWWTKRALIMLNFLLETRQNYLYCIHAHEHLDGKHIRLRPPARAVAGHAAHGQRSLHHAKAEVICHLQPVFWHVENALNNFRQVTFWGITTFCHRQMGQNFGCYRIFVQRFVPERGCLPWFCITKIINSSQFIEILKVKMTLTPWKE